MEDGLVTDRFQRLMCPKQRISRFIESYTGITNRILQDAPNHKLGTLVRYKNLPTDGTFHRALADAEMTTHLWLKMLEDMESRYGIDQADFALMQKLGKTAKGKTDEFLRKSAVTA